MNVRLRHNLNFTAGIWYGDKLRMNHYTLSVSMTTNSLDPSSHNIAFERLKFFIYTKMESTIFVNSACQDQCEKFVAAGLSVTTMPGEPVDQLIGLMLYCKLNAIMEDRIIINETEISSMLGENMIYLHVEDEITDVTNIPEWWNTADLVHSDYVSLEADKILTMRSSSIWRELDLTWPDAEQTSETGNIVVYADFKSNHETK